MKERVINEKKVREKRHTEYFQVQAAAAARALR